MKLILKQFLIIGATFLIILWIQNIDDKKHNKKRDTLYDKYKLPVLVSAIIGLIFAYIDYILNPRVANDNLAIDLTVISPVREAPSVEISKSEISKPITQSISEAMSDRFSNFPESTNELPVLKNKGSWSNLNPGASTGTQDIVKKSFNTDLSSQEVFTDLADF